MNRAFRLRFDLGAEPSHVDVDGSWIADLVGSPDTVEQLATRVGAAWVGGEHRKELELLWAKVNGATMQTELMRDEIELEAGGDGQRPRWSRSSLILEERGSSRELDGRDRLRERLVEAIAKGRDATLDVGARAQVDRAESFATPSLGADDLLLSGARRRLCHDRDTGSGAGEQVGEGRRIGNGPHAYGGRSQVAEFEPGSVGSKHEPHRPGMRRTEPGR